jgi:hypothetical protein
MRRAWRGTIALLVGITAAFASALEVPSDAELFVTDEGSRIVGIGRVVAGTSFELVLEDGFAGPAVVVWLSLDGGVRTTEVVVADGVVWVDGEELTSVLPETFVEVHVRLAKELGDAWTPGVGQGPPADVPGLAKGREPPRADPPGPPGAPPGLPDDGPPAADPPGPPDDRPPGAAEDPPGRRPSGP